MRSDISQHTVRFVSTQVEHSDLMCYPNGIVRKLVECLGLAA